ncbi:MAG: L-rhamnose isomerase [bacterium]
MTRELAVEQNYHAARAAYAALGVDTDAALEKLAPVALALHCWQGDDVRGFEPRPGSLAGSGLWVGPGQPGRARNPEELRSDLDAAFALIPGHHRLNLHAMYGEFPHGLDRNRIAPEHFAGWLDWARGRVAGLDFNPTLFAHPLAESGYTLSHTDPQVRRFWVEHVKRSRKVAALLGRELGSPSVCNLWIPDGARDVTVDRFERRTLLRDALDEVYKRNYPDTELRDSLEGKLWGVGAETFTVGSWDFYLGYALTRSKTLCLDLGHFHPTESVADKVSALLLFAGELLLHVSRPVRWDSDHTVTITDDLRELFEEIVRADALDRVRLALDYFDPGANRIGAWVTGARATLRCLLAALLQPAERLRACDRVERLALLDELRTLPLGAVWDYHCLKSGVPAGLDWLEEVRRYELNVLSRRA